MTIETGEDILANIGAVGFYRVNYDASMWQSLIGKLASAQFKVCSLRADTQETQNSIQMQVFDRKLT